MNSPTRLKQMRYSFIALIACIYVVSLILPVAYDTSQNMEWYGWNILLMGWTGIFAGFWGWVANPLLLWSLSSIALEKYGQALAVALAASVVGLQTLLFFASQPVYIPDNTYLVGPRIGYYVWQGALIITAVYCFLIPPVKQIDLRSPKKSK